MLRGALAGRWPDPVLPGDFPAIDPAVARNSLRRAEESDAISIEFEHRMTALLNVRATENPFRRGLVATVSAVFTDDMPQRLARFEVAKGKLVDAACAKLEERCTECKSAIMADARSELRRALRGSAGASVADAAGSVITDILDLCVLPALRVLNTLQPESGWLDESAARAAQRREAEANLRRIQGEIARMEGMHDAMAVPAPDLHVPTDTLGAAEPRVPGEAAPAPQAARLGGPETATPPGAARPAAK